MAKENVKDFATSNLAAAITSTSTSFAVTTGQGAYFPYTDSTHPTPFLVSIDQELISCQRTSGSDTFTVVQRGAEGTTAASHAINATVNHGMTSGMVDHIWTNLAEHFNADVPPYARNGIAPSQWDDEFEASNTTWTVYPAVSGNDVIDFNVMHSCLRFSRGDFSNNTYVVYKPFVPGANVPFTVMAKMSHGARMYGLAPNTSPIPLEASLFVSDQTVVPVTDTGNLARIDHNLNDYQVQITQPDGSNPGTWRVPVVKSAVVNSNSYNPLYWTLAQGYTYYAMTFDGSGTYTFWVGDGYTWTGIGTYGKVINVQSVGFRFLAYNASNSRTQQNIAIDWIRFYLNWNLNTPY